MRTSRPDVCTSMQSFNASPDWALQIPLSALVALQGLPSRMEALERENAQLRRELEGLRTIQSQCLQMLADAKRGRMSG